MDSSPERTTSAPKPITRTRLFQRVSTTVALCLLLWTTAFTQDWIRTGTGLGVEKVRIAVPDFKISTQDPKNDDLLKVFNSTLWNDLDNAGIFDMVSKSFYPLGMIGAPADVKFDTERVKYWIERGAKPSEAVAVLLKKCAVEPNAPAESNQA